MKKIIVRFLLPGLLAIASCNTKKNSVKEGNVYEPGSFGYDLNFLQQHDSVIVLGNDNEMARVIVSPRYQAKVFTSTAEGNKGKSFGWLNYKAFTAPADPHMNAYGGENRFWLGPEGGIFSLYFKKGEEMTFDNWQTPAPIDTEPWEVVSRNETTVRFQKEMDLLNYAGTPLSITAYRDISLLSNDTIEAKTGMALPAGIKAVGYITSNTIVNKGQFIWDEKTGMPCIWILDMFNPSDETTIIIPYKDEAASSGNNIATTDYFGQIPPDRIKYRNNVLLFKADGKNRGKLGIAPGRAKPIAGSYDDKNQVLTVTIFDVASDAKYLNQEWSTAKPAFSGDAVNAYNDGPLADGGQLGPFYEIESVSPAAFLKPGETLNHRHYVFHFSGDKKGLDSIAKKVLGISLYQVKM